MDNWRYATRIFYSDVIHWIYKSDLISCYKLIKSIQVNTTLYYCSLFSPRLKCNLQSDDLGQTHIGSNQLWKTATVTMARHQTQLTQNHPQVKNKTRYSDSVTAVDSHLSLTVSKPGHFKLHKDCFYCRIIVLGCIETKLHRNKLVI